MVRNQRPKPAQRFNTPTVTICPVLLYPSILKFCPILNPHQHLTYRYYLFFFDQSWPSLTLGDTDKGTPTPPPARSENKGSIQRVEPDLVTTMRHVTPIVWHIIQDHMTCWENRRHNMSQAFCHLAAYTQRTLAAPNNTPKHQMCLNISMSASDLVNFNFSVANLRNFRLKLCIFLTYHLITNESSS